MIRITRISPSAAAAASIVTSIGLAMSAASALDRAATGADLAIWVSASLSITAAAHVLPAVTRSAIGYAIWSACMLVALYGHAGFVAGSQHRAGEQRANAVQQTEHQRAVRDQLAGLTAQSPAEAAAALANARSRAAAFGAALARCEAQTPGRCASPRAAQAAAAARADAADEALQQARQAAALRATLAAAANAQDARRETARVEPAALALAHLTGLPTDPIQLGMSLLTAMLVELLGALLWRRAIHITAEAHHDLQHTTEPTAPRDRHQVGPAVRSRVEPAGHPHHRHPDNWRGVSPDAPWPRHGGDGMGQVRPGVVDTG